MQKVREYLLIADAAQFLGVSQNTLRAWGKDGKIPEHRHPLNRYRLYKQSDLEKFLKQIERSLSTPLPRKRPR